jgi:hypothetical protein
MTMIVVAIFCGLAVFGWRLHRTDRVLSALVVSVFAVVAVGVASALVSTDALAPEAGHKSKRHASRHAGM